MSCYRRSLLSSSARWFTQQRWAGTGLRFDLVKRDVGISLPNSHWAGEAEKQLFPMETPPTGKGRAVTFNGN